jgi:predicted amidophosphoribosyltransferase
MGYTMGMTKKPSTTCPEDCRFDTPWTHCPRCGAPVTWDDDPGCDDCGLILGDSGG